MLIDKDIKSIENIDFKEGAIILINKEKDWTSFDVVARIRNLISKSKQIKKLKVGHGGTLDPRATGLMIIATGTFTKKLQEIQDDTKEYIATVTFGATTPSYDTETEIDQHFDYAHITQQSIEETLQKEFSGEIIQKPPIYSAKSVNGQRAYKAARKGESIDIPPQKICIYETEIITFSNPNLIIRIKCSKGTYIRSIAYDLGKSLNSGAYLQELHRTASGSFKATKSLTIEGFKELITQ